MKKILFLFLCLIFASSLFALDNNNFVHVMGLLEKQKIEDLEAVTTLSLRLDNTERYLLYQDYQKESYTPFLINFTAGLGLGSFMQKDYQGGTIGLCGDLLGATMTTLGALMANNTISGCDKITSTLLTAAGGVLLASSRIFQIVRPFIHAEKYNRQLKRALFTNTSFAVVPYSEKGESLGLAASFSIKL